MYRTDAPSEFFWDQARNKPYGPDCANAYDGAVSIYGAANVWQWASRYRTDWDEQADGCLIRTAVVADPVNIAWDDIAQASHFELYLRRADDESVEFSKWLEASKVCLLPGECAYRLGDLGKLGIALEAGAEYRAWIRPINVDIKGPWSPPASFEYVPVAAIVNVILGVVNGQ